MNVSYPGSATGNYTRCIISMEPDFRYEASSVILLLTSLVSSILNLLFLIVMCRTKSFHANVRLLLQNFSVASFGLAIHSLGISVYALLNLIYGFDQLVMPKLPCQLSHILHDMCQVAWTSSLALIGIERLWNNLMHNFSEQERPTLLAYSLLCLCWLIGLGMHGIMTGLVITAVEEEQPICFCHSIFARPFASLCFSLGTCIAGYIIIVITYTVLYKRSVHALLIFGQRRLGKRPSHNSLTERYHLAKNVRLCQLLWPSLIIKFCIDVLTSVGSIWVRISRSEILQISGYNHDDMDYIFYTLVITNFLVLDTLCHPLLLTARDGRLRRMTLNTYPFLNRCVQAGEENSDMQQHSIEEVTQLSGPGRLRFRRRSPTGETLELVDYRMNPEQHDNILNAMWSECARR